MNESSTDPFQQRRKGLEEAFFKQRDQELMQKMRLELSAFEDKRKLAHITGIAEDRVLTNLVKAGVGAETLTAVALVPLLEVAWCDGAVSPEEREAILNAAAAQGIHQDSAAHGLLSSWLSERPDPRIVIVWRDYVREMVHLLPKDTSASLRDNFMERAKNVAAAAGGFLGLSTISQKERAKIEELSKAWDG
jgi:tellurite resistance protein